jgi:Icc-related predicted phosphoesterase
MKTSSKESMMRLLCLSDMHGQLRPYDAPQFTAHVAVIAGDVTPAQHRYYGGRPEGLLAQEQWFAHTFLPWVQMLPVEHVVMTWGNHDHLGEHPDRYRSLLPSNVHVLVNESCVIDGMHFHGVPQTPRFHDWAFNEDDTDTALGRRWSQVPEGTDVLISHGPPRGSVDWVHDRRSERVGSLTQAQWLQSNPPNLPSMIVCGHLHSGGGHAGWCGDARILNVSIVDERYEVVRPPKVIDCVSRSSKSEHVNVGVME